jgi:poly-gamma-glutamate synthesis protein (capsule biosynthesis protein)
MYNKFFLYLTFSFYLGTSNCSVAQPVSADTPAQPQVDTTRVTLLFAGDVMAHMPQISSAYDSSTGTYDFNPVFSLVKPLVSKPDVAIANLETTLAGKPFAGYPQFSAPDSLATALKHAGFDILITANNHCLDRGQQGLERTVEMLDSFGIPHTGTFVNDSVRKSTYPYIFEVKGVKLALLNCTYSTNGIPVQRPNVVNYIDTNEIRRDLSRAKQANVDYTIVTIHWGIEYDRNENAEQRNIANFLLKNGADMVIGSHPHVVQPVKMNDNPNDTASYSLVVYSLGNYVSNQRDRYKNGGIMLNVTLQKTTKTRLADYSYTPVWVYKGPIDNKLQYRVVPLSNDTVQPEFFDADSKLKANQFYNDTKALLNNIPVN